MQREFVTYEIALKLKELGFNEECLAAFSDDEYHDLLHLCENHTEGNFTIESSRYRIKAPLWQQVIDWFREKYGIYILIMPCRIPSNEIKYYIFKGKLKWDWNELYNTCEEAREQEILKSIEICQKKK